MTRRKWYQNQIGIARFAEYDPNNTGIGGNKMQSNSAGQKFWTNNALERRGVSAVKYGPIVIPPVGSSVPTGGIEAPSMSSRNAQAKGRSPATLVGGVMESAKERARVNANRGAYEVRLADRLDAIRQKDLREARMASPEKAPGYAKAYDQASMPNKILSAERYKQQVEADKLAKGRIAALSEKALRESGAVLPTNPRVVTNIPPAAKAIEAAAVEVSKDKGLGQVAVKGKKKFFMRKQMVLLKRYPKQAAMIAGGALVAGVGAKLIYDQLNKPKMKNSNFSMSQVQAAWNRDRNNPEAMAYFAEMSDGDWAKAGIDTDRNAMAIKRGGLRNAVGNVGNEIGKKAVSAKNKVAVLVTRDGKQFMQARWKNVQDIAGKAGAMAKGAAGHVDRAWAGAGTGGKVAMGVAAIGGGYAVGAAARQALGWNEPGKDPLRMGIKVKGKTYSTASLSSSDQNNLDNAYRRANS